MISVKGTRQPDADAAEKGERYEFINSEGLGRIPMYIGLLITGIAFYLKTSFAAPAGSTKSIPYSSATRALGTTRRVENGPNTRSTSSCAMSAS